MARFDNNFANAVHDFVKPGMRVLDMGAGVGAAAIRFRDQGAIVTAVDKRSFNNSPEGIEWIFSSVEEFIKTCPADREFELIFIQNLIHFLPKPFVFEELIPWACAHTAPGGMVGIRAFTASPVPSYREPLTYYTPAELAEAFSGWEKVVSETGEYEGPVYRTFIVDRLARKGNPT